ncbi:MAG: SH3 domain-containing protein [Clostridia bacterium]|nr:SH3 domain-containing protein [Clostridia bacterium]
MKKIVSLLLILALMLPLCATAQVIGGTGTMYVYTENGKGLNVRSYPAKGDNIIGSLAYGDSVFVLEFLDGWCRILWGSYGDAYVQSRFLQWYAPGPKPTSKPAPKPTTEPEKNKEDAELKSEVEIGPITLQVKSSRSSGWVNVRKGPSAETNRIESCPDGTMLTAYGETTNWYRIVDPSNGKAGYISKHYVTVIPTPYPVVEQTAQIGSLNVNGEFTLQCKIPEGYNLQVISARSSKIIATLTAADVQKPQMMLTVAFNELYADVERMNDLSAEDIELLKATYSEMNEVEFKEAETSHGTKLLIAKEIGADEDFVSILSIYQGYSIEFVLSPNPDAVNKTLTDAQIQKCIDFLSDLDFIPTVGVSK